MEKIGFKSAKEKISSPLKILGLLALLGGNTEQALAGNASSDLELLKNRTHVADNRIRSGPAEANGDHVKTVKLESGFSAVFTDTTDGLFIKEILDENGKKVTGFFFDRRKASTDKLEGDPSAMVAVEGETNGSEDKIIEAALASDASGGEKISLKHAYTAFFKTEKGGVLVGGDGNVKHISKSDAEYTEAVRLMRGHYDQDVSWVATEDEGDE